MKEFDVDLEINGKPFTVTVQAENADQAMEFVGMQANTSEGMRSILDLAGEHKPEEKGFLNKAWDALAVPEKMSREGLTKLAEFVPEGETTGNLVADIARGTPRILADTIAEGAPSFISRGALVTGGALRGAKALSPLAKMAGRQIAKGAESISGLEYKTPGILQEAARDSKLLFAPGTKKAGEKFAEFADKTKIRPEFSRATSAKDLIKQALGAVDDGTLTPQEALIARQTLDGIKRNLPRYSYNEMRNTFDAVAKTVSKEADAAFSRGVKAESLRNLFPTNKSGGTSIAKSFLGSLAGFVPMVGMSPLAQGTVATGVGALARTFPKNPLITGTAVGGLVDLIRRNPKEGQ